MTNEQTDSWNEFCGKNFLKSTDVANEQDVFVVIDVETFEDEGEQKLRTILERKDITYKFDLNVTNSNFCKNAGIRSPKMLIGKKFYFKKVLVNSPKTKKEVESLRISKIE